MSLVWSGAERREDLKAMLNGSIHQMRARVNFLSFSGVLCCKLAVAPVAGWAWLAGDGRWGIGRELDAGSGCCFRAGGWLAGWLAGWLCCSLISVLSALFSAVSVQYLGR